MVCLQQRALLARCHTAVLVAGHACLHVAAVSLHSVLLPCCGIADARRKDAMLAACAARRWLARNAAALKRIRIQNNAAASVCMNLVSCLPALEDVDLHLAGPSNPHKLSCLLEAPSWCPRLRVLYLRMWQSERRQGNQAALSNQRMPAFTKLRSLTQLVLEFGSAVPFTLAAVV